MCTFICNLNKVFWIEWTRGTFKPYATTLLYCMSIYLAANPNIIKMIGTSGWNRVTVLWERMTFTVSRSIWRMCLLFGLCTMVPVLFCYLNLQIFLPLRDSRIKLWTQHSSLFKMIWWICELTVVYLRILQLQSNFISHLEPGLLLTDDCKSNIQYGLALLLVSINFWGKITLLSQLLLRFLKLFVSVVSLIGLVSHLLSEPKLKKLFGVV